MERGVPMKRSISPSKFQTLYVGYVVASLALFLYSYTQVDLNLTLSSAGMLGSVQRSFQYVGFYLRPVSAMLYVCIVAGWYGLYALALHLAREGALSSSFAWSIVIAVTTLLLFSYPAFSYDVFNYLFTAKTVLVYRKNPYEVIPLQFASIDPLVSVMRWTHLPSAYTPLWILLTLPAYLLGFGKFLLVMWNLKLLVGFFYLVAVAGVRKVLERIEPKRAAMGTVLFALNPLVVIESLVSAHNDIVMVAIAVWAIVALLEKKLIASWIAVSFSVAVKLMTVALAPVFVAAYRKAIDWRAWSLIAMLAAFFAVLTQREPLPWYWVWIAPFIAFLPSKKWLTTLACWYSFALLLRYAPYLYFGNWNEPVPTIKWWVTIAPVLTGVLVLLLDMQKQAKPTSTA